MNKAVYMAVVLAVSAGTFFMQYEPAQAAISDWQKGMNVYPHSPEDFAGTRFVKSLQNLKKTGADHVSLVIPIYQDSDTSSEIKAGIDTPTDAALLQGIRQARSLGFEVMLKVHLESLSGTGWRAQINATDRDAWFRNYGRYLNRLGDTAQAGGAKGLCIGTELISMATFTSNPDNTARWQKMISDLRVHFDGFLTYNANWAWGAGNFEDEWQHIGFWNSLDYVSISAYYPLAEGESNPSVELLKESWNYWDQNQVKTIYEQFKKPILFTEVGFKSADNAHSHPCCTFVGAYDGVEQANDYEATFRHWNEPGKEYVAGAYFWMWDADPDYGGPGNTDYTPHGKPAEEVLARWYGGDLSGGNGGGGGDNGNEGKIPSSSEGEWSSSGNVNIVTVGRQSPVNLHASVSGKAENVMVDAEIYDQNGVKVYQRIYENQDFVGRAPRQYVLDWMPARAGTYTLKLGIFRNDWSGLYYWNDSVLTIAAAGDGSLDREISVDAWWPVDGIATSGTQPVKALLSGVPLGEYEMVWFIDTDPHTLNRMANNLTDYPHKEGVINVDDWKGSQTGEYILTIRAKTRYGITIAERSMKIRQVRP